MIQVSSSAACGDIVCDGPSRCSCPDRTHSRGSAAVTPDGDGRPRRTGTAVIALRGASRWQRDMPGREEDNGIMGSHDLAPFSPLTFTLSLSHFTPYSPLSPHSVSSLLTRQPLAALLLFAQPRPPAVCPPPPKASTQLPETGTAAQQEQAMCARFSLRNISS